MLIFELREVTAVGEKKNSSQFENSQDNKLTHSYYSNEAHYFHIASLKHNLK